VHHLENIVGGRCEVRYEDVLLLGPAAYVFKGPAAEDFIILSYCFPILLKVKRKFQQRISMIFVMFVRCASECKILMSSRKYA